MNEAAKESTFDVWGLLELFGHQRLAGRISEVSIGGGSFIRIDVPDVDGISSHTRFFGAGAIYGISPTTEEVARQLASAMRAMPFTKYDLPRQEPRKLVTQVDDDMEPPI